MFALATMLIAACSKPSSEPTISVRPGDSVEIAVEGIELSRGLSMRVLVGGRQSQYVKVLDPGRLEIRVPLLPSGVATVEMQIDGRSFAGPILQVTALDNQSMTIFVEADSAIITAVAATYDPLPAGPAPATITRISYDFFSEDGSVHIMTTLPHPLGDDYQVVGGGHDDHGNSDPAAGDSHADHGMDHHLTEPYEFQVVIPVVKGRAILRVFEAQAGLDLTVPHNLHGRKLLGEFLLPLAE